MVVLAVSGGAHPGLDLASVLILAFTALAAVAAAVAAFRTAAATRDVAGISRQSALLTTVPLLVPWVSEDTGEITVVNRGASASHVLRWTVNSEVAVSEGVVELEETASGSDQKVIRPLAEVNTGRALKLTKDERFFVQELARQREVGFTIECRYQASWGQEFMTTRAYPPGSTESEISIMDAHGNELRLESGPRRRWRLLFWQ